MACPCNPWKVQFMLQQKIFLTFWISEYDPYSIISVCQQSSLTALIQLNNLEQKSASFLSSNPFSSVLLTSIIYIPCYRKKKLRISRWNFFTIMDTQNSKELFLNTIRQSAAIVLKENVFVYDHKIYHQILGGTMSLSFTLTLANVFMWKWPK